MRRVLLTLSAIGVLAVAASQARAEGALSYPMAAHVAAKYGLHHPGHNTAVIREVSHRYRGPYRPRPHWYHRGPGPVIVHPPVYRRLPVVVPVYPPIYRYGPYYPRPRGGFSYYGPGFSIGIGF